MKKILINVLVLAIMFTLFSAACSSGPPTVTVAPPGQDDGSGAAEPTQAPASSDEASDPTEETEIEQEPIPVDERGIPLDIPIMEGAYDIQVSLSRSGVDINFRVDMSVEDTVAYFQENLPTMGWMETTSKDTAFGALGSMARINEAEDNMALSMNYNPGGEFTQVVVSVSRTIVD